MMCPDMGETQPFMMPCGSESPYADDPSRRISRSMMPEGYMQKTGKDFDWSLYGEDTEPQKKIVNAFVTRYAEFERSGRGLYISQKSKDPGKHFWPVSWLMRLQREGRFRLNLLRFQTSSNW